MAPKVGPQDWSSGHVLRKGKKGQGGDSGGGALEWQLQELEGVL